MKSLLLLALCVTLATAEVIFKEEFDAGWDKRWQTSSWKKKEGNQGEFKWSAGKWYGDAEKDKGIQTSQDSKFYALYSEFKKPFTNKEKELIVQYSAKNEQEIDCGGSYIKLLPSSSKMKDFGGDTPYSVMFGPDICGFSTRKTHVIFTYNGKNHLVKKDIKCETDGLTHVYTLRLMPNNTYEVYIDKAKVDGGSLYEDFDMLAPKTIKDPKAKKPADWDEREEIPDPEDKKPEGWDDIPATIPDKDAKKPEDWDDEDDGEWEPPMIANPEYKGEWKQKMMKNPDYKGKWVAPDIPNPDYKHDDFLYLFKDLKYVGFELWQVKSGTIMDNIIVADSLEEAFKFADDTWGAVKDAEKKMHDEVKAADAEAQAAKDAEKKDEDKTDEDDEYEDDDDKPAAVEEEAVGSKDDEDEEKDEL